MLLKDYYNILEVEPSASGHDIKQSFRRLVLLFHPDKNAGDAVAAARFREIREAYEVLSHPQRRGEYNYKRWYNRSVGKAYDTTPLTPQAILLECRRLQDYLAAVSGARVDYDALSHHIRQLLNETNIRLLQQGNDTGANRELAQRLMAASAPLPWKYISPIAGLLRQAAGADALAQQAITAFEAQHRQSDRWNRYRVPLVLAVTLFLCWLIYLVSK